LSSDELATIAQKAARGGLFIFIGNASSTVILALGVIAVARLLGPSDYGLYTLALAVPIILVSLSDAGINFALVRLPARLGAEGNHAEAEKLIRLGFLLKLTISTIAFIICYFGSATIATTVLNRSELAPFLRIASILVVFHSMFDAACNSFIGQDRMHYSASIQVLQSTLKGTLGPALVLVGFGIAGAISGFVLSLAAAGLVGTALLFVNHTRSSSQATGLVSTDLHRLLGYALPLYVATILSVFLTQYQNIVLAHFTSNTEIGNFVATWNFTAFMAILAYPFATAMFPMFSKMDPKNQRSDLARGFILAVKYTSLLIIPASVAVMVFSRDLIFLTYGSDYASAPQYLVILSVVYLLAAIGSLVLGSFLSGVAETGTVVRMSFLALVVYLPLGPALAWLWGAYGILVAYVLSSAASTVYGIHQTSIKYDARPDLRASAGVLIAALTAAIPSITLVQLHLTETGVVNLIAGGILYVVAYLTLAPALGAVDKFDIMNLRTILSLVPLQYYGPVEARFVTSTGLGQNRLDQNLLEITTVEGNVLDPTLIRTQMGLERKDSGRIARKVHMLMIRIVAISVGSIFEYELKLLSAIRRD